MEYPVCSIYIKTLFFQTATKPHLIVHLLDNSVALF